MRRAEDIKVVIVDYELGNLFSVNQALENLGVHATISRDKAVIAAADAIVLPGVGAFADAMENLRKNDLVTTLRDFAASGKPFMGICLGLQLLFTASEEFEEKEGLGIIPGKVRKFPAAFEGTKLKVPQIAWNKVYPANDSNWSASPLKDLQPGDYMYFVHSFYVVPDNQEVALTKTAYEGFEYCSGIIQNNVFATQFHPEKSADAGLTIYRNWINTIVNN